MRVLHVVGSLSPKWGGLSRAVAGMAGAMAPMGIDVEIIATRSGNEDFLQPAGNGIKVEVFPRGPLAWWGYAPRMGAAIEAAVRRADLVHIHGLWLYPHFISARTARRIRKPYIVSPHGMLDPWALGHKKLKKRVYGSMIEWPNLRRAAAIHVVAENEVADIRRLHLHVPVFLIPNGIDNCELSQLPHRSILLSRFPHLAGKIVILFLSRIHPKKGLDLLSEAFAKVSAKRDDVILLAAGPDEIGYWGQIESTLKASGAKDRYIYTGMLTGEERLAALAAADIFVLPSYSEGFPVAVVEAMGAGLPIVVTPACHVSGIEERGAGFVAATEAGALSEAILKLVDDPALRRAMGERGRKLVRAEYTWDKVAARMAKAYGSVLSQAEAPVCLGLSQHR